MKGILKTLCLLDGVSGYEGKVRSAIRKLAQPCAEEILEDNIGNLMVFKKGAARRKSPLVVAAHMDEPGFWVSGYTKEGCLKLVSVGKLDLRGIAGHRVCVGMDSIPGIIVRKTSGESAPEKWGENPALSEFCVEIGAQSDALAKERVFIGDPVSLHSGFAEFGEQCVLSKALCSRAGCAVALKMLQNDLPYDTWFAFTVGAETSDSGARGSIAVGNRLKPCCTLILNGSAAEDLPGVPAHKQFAELRRGPMVSLIDAETVYHRGLRKKILDAAEKSGVRWQYRRGGTGGDDGAALHVSGTGAAAFGLSVPVRYCRSAASVLCMTDMEETYRLAAIFNEEAGDWNA